jgi:hypothetical protein
MRVRWPDGLLISSTAVVLDYSPILFFSHGESPDCWADDVPRLG